MSIRNRLFHAWFLMSRPLTLGARAIVVDGEDAVLLVRHTYVPGWHLPGGGIEPGETALECVRREVREEGNVEIDDHARLHGLFHNTAASRRDHVAVYVCRAARHLGPKAPDREIAEARFFPLAALPAELTPASGRRIGEWRTGEAPGPHW